jgi:hypothetical protein
MIRSWLRWPVMAAALSLLLATAPVAMARQDSETVWANGQEWTMIAPHAITDPNPNLLATAPPLYVLAFPSNGHGGWVLPPDYSPQCDPCLGVPVPPYHDHLLTGAPGFGTQGTSGGDYMAPWRLELMMYSPAYILGGHFVPVTSDEDLATAIAEGEFLPIGPNGSYAVPLPVVLICPLVSPNAAGQV